MFLCAFISYFSLTIYKAVLALNSDLGLSRVVSINWLTSQTLDTIHAKIQAGFFYVVDKEFPPLQLLKLNIIKCREVYLGQSIFNNVFHLVVSILWHQLKYQRIY